MVWTQPPRTWVSGETVTHTIMNTHVRDQLTALRFAEYTNDADAGNVDADEDDLHSYSVPADTLANDGETLRWDTVFSLAANGNNKTIKVYFGSSGVTIYTGTGNNLQIAVTVWIMRSAAAQQKLWLSAIVDTTSHDAGFAVPTETLSGAVTFKFTGEATATDDVRQRASILKFVG